MNRKIKITLILSITLNIIFISYHFGRSMNVIASFYGMQYREKQMITVISKDKQELARQTFEELHQIRKDKMNDSKEILAELEKAAIANNFNKKIFLRQLQIFHNNCEKNRASSDIIVADFLSNLDQSDREKIVEQFKKTTRHFKN